MQEPKAGEGIEVVPGVWWLSLPLPGSYMGAVNVYLLQDREGFVLVDCGLDTDESWRALQAQLARVGLSPHAIRILLVTHAHPDHYGLAARLRDQSDGCILLHPREQEYIAQRYLSPGAYREKLKRWLLRYGFPGDEADRVVGSMEQGRHRAPALLSDRALAGGEVLQIGEYTFQVMWTPGHTPGHICLYEPDHGLIISGDHILERVAPNVGLQPYSSDNPLPGYLQSLTELASLPIRLALPGHGAPLRDLGGRARELLQHQEGRRARLLALLTGRPQTAYELAAQVWADSRPSNWSQFGALLRRNAVGTIAAHLELLAQEGKAARYEDETVRFARP